MASGDPADTPHSMLVVFTLWSAVNLVDYFTVRHGDYDVPSLSGARGGCG